MSYRRVCLRALGLCLIVAVGSMAAAAGSAVAGPDWLIKDPGPPVTDELVNGPAAFQTENDITVAIESKVAGVEVKVSCEKTEVSGNLESEGKISGTFPFNGCSTFLNGTLSAACKPSQPLQAKFKGESFEHAGDGYLLLLPASGTQFMSIQFGEECAIGEKFKVKGSIVLKDCNNDLATYLVRHLLQEAAAALFASGAHIDALKFGANTPRLAGSEWYKLPSGREWKWMA